ncbi:MAG: hypothetical protein JOZ99_02890, partial [Actinobacteria bacterium]|nr:hypothetical protein [Actinomycetota bacterium]
RELLGDARRAAARVDELERVALRLARDLARTYQQARPMVRRALNQAIFATITIRGDAIERVEYQPPFEPLAGPAARRSV